MPRNRLSSIRSSVVSSAGSSVVTLCLLVGLALFLFPEPFTSTLGIVLVVVGVVGWLLG